MQVYTIDITSWTASFRYPNLISGFQPTLEVPPISTILGLINATTGSYQHYDNLKIAYYFEYKGKDVDLETIYQIGSNKGVPSNNAKSNVIRREFLSDTFLRLYVLDEKIANFFRKPYYPLVLGRMNDLASVSKIERKEIIGLPKAEKLRGQIIPFLEYKLPGQIQALPKYFTDTFPRNNLGTEPYSIINYKNKLQADIEVFRDEEKQVDVFFHDLKFPS